MAHYFDHEDDAQAMLQRLLETVRPEWSSWAETSQPKAAQTMNSAASGDLSSARGDMGCRVRLPTWWHAKQSVLAPRRSTSTQAGSPFRFVLVRPDAQPLATLEVYGTLEVIGNDKVFPTLEDAFRAYQADPATAPPAAHGPVNPVIVVLAVALLPLGIHGGSESGTRGRRRPGRAEQTHLCPAASSVPSGQVNG
jgi:hypothetical protein